jgi:hypothetical protein
LQLLQETASNLALPVAGVVADASHLLADPAQYAIQPQYRPRLVICQAIRSIFFDKK